MNQAGFLNLNKKLVVIYSMIVLFLYFFKL